MYLSEKKMTTNMSIYYYIPGANLNFTVYRTGGKLRKC